MKSKTNSSRRIAAAETDPEPEPPVYPSVSHSKPILPIWLQIGISVDHRRKNSSLEGLQYNVQRLKTYQAKLVVFPPRSRVVKAVDSTPEELANAIQVQGDYMPIAREKVAMELVTADMKAFKAYDKIRLERTNKRHAGVRAKRAADAEKEENK